MHGVTLLLQGVIDRMAILIARTSFPNGNCDLNTPFFYGGNPVKVGGDVVKSPRLFLKGKRINLIPGVVSLEDG
jgi:hypothetical protein